MRANVIVELTQIDQLELIQKQVFNVLDISEGTRKEYSARIRHFIRYTQTHGINSNTYLQYKRYLSATETFSIATKNKYLIAAKVFLDGLYRLQIICIKITDNIKGFSQSKLHKKNGLDDKDITKIQNYCSDANKIENKFANKQETTFQTILIISNLSIFLIWGYLLH